MGAARIYVAVPELMQPKNIPGVALYAHPLRCALRQERLHAAALVGT